MDGFMRPGTDRTVRVTEPYVDHVKRMRQFLGRHPEVKWLRPGEAGVAHQTATWSDAGPDPVRGGTPVTVSREDLGMLVDYLEYKFEGCGRR